MPTLLGQILLQPHDPCLAVRTKPLESRKSSLRYGILVRKLLTFRDEREPARLLCLKVKPLLLVFDFAAHRRQEAAKEIKDRNERTKHPEDEPHHPVEPVGVAALEVEPREDLLGEPVSIIA